MQHRLRSMAHIKEKRCPSVPPVLYFQNYISFICAAVPKSLDVLPLFPPGKSELSLCRRPCLLGRADGCVFYSRASRENYLIPLSVYISRNRHAGDQFPEWASASMEFWLVFNCLSIVFYCVFVILTFREPENHYSGSNLFPLFIGLSWE